MARGGVGADIDLWRNRASARKTSLNGGRRGALMAAYHARHLAYARIMNINASGVAARR
jgi:hypothetical protein